MFKLIILGIVAFIIYKIFFNKKMVANSSNKDDNELIECSKCHTFVPKSECKFRNNECLCKECL
jgi:uncharacterized protein